MAVNISGQVAIVTGGNRGFGAGIAEVLTARGVDVWITGRDEGLLSQVAERLGVRAVRADVTSAADWDGLMARVLAESGRLDILVNNAGAGVSIAPLDEQTDADIELSLDINLTGPIMGCRRAAKIMKDQRGGTIVNVSSACGRLAWPGYSVYTAAKAGLIDFTKCLYLELQPFGARATSVIPAWGATDFLENSGRPARDPEQNKRVIQPTEMGELVAHVCETPPHLMIQDVTLWPLVQEVQPL